MSGDPQTKQNALDLLLEIAGSRRALLEDERLKEALSDDLIAEVFETAWKRQWDKSDKALLREVRPAIDAAVSRAVVSRED